MSSTKFYLFFVLALVLKLVFSSMVPFLPDEAYYWVWSYHLDWSYFDHPPMISWFLWISRHIIPDPFFIRWPGIVLSHFIFYIWLKIFLHLKPSHESAVFEKRSFLFLSVFFVHPFIGYGLFVLTPDLMYLLFSSLTILLYLNLLKKYSNLTILMLGLFLGLSFTSKYHAVLLGICLLIHSLIYRRDIINLKSIFLLVTFGLIGCAPVLYWNYLNNWSSFIFQMEHGFTKKVWKSSWTTSYLASQILLISPFIFYFYIQKIKYDLALRKNELFTFSFVCLFFISTFFLYSSTQGFVEANWGLIVLPIPLVAFVAHASDKLINYYIRYFAFIFVIAIAVISFSKNDNIKDQWRNQISDSYQIKKISKELEKYTPLYAGTYQTASLVWFHTQRPTYKLYQSSRYDMYDRWIENSHTKLLQSPIKPNSIPDQFYLFKLKETALPDWLKQLPNYKAIEIKDYNESWHVIKITKIEENP